MRSDNQGESVFIIRNSGARDVDNFELSKGSKRRIVRSGASNPIEIRSELFSQDVVFLSQNNTDILAHKGSTVTLSCQILKSPNFGMVS